jgi:hypothetical protein
VYVLAITPLIFRDFREASGDRREIRIGFEPRGCHNSQALSDSIQTFVDTA